MVLKVPPESPKVLLKVATSDALTSLRPAIAMVWPVPSIGVLAFHKREHVVDRREIVWSHVLDQARTAAA